MFVCGKGEEEKVGDACRREAITQRELASCVHVKLTAGKKKKGRLSTRGNERESERASERDRWKT